jgi:hypothetical protein
MKIGSCNLLAFVCLFVCLSVCLFVCLSVCLFVCLSVCLSSCLSVCLSSDRSACLEPTNLSLSTTSTGTIQPRFDVDTSWSKYLLQVQTLRSHTYDVISPENTNTIVLAIYILRSARGTSNGRQRQDLTHKFSNLR